MENQFHKWTLGETIEKEGRRASFAAENPFEKNSEFQKKFLPEFYFPHFFPSWNQDGWIAERSSRTENKIDSEQCSIFSFSISLQSRAHLPKWPEYHYKSGEKRWFSSSLRAIHPHFLNTLDPFAVSLNAPCLSASHPRTALNPLWLAWRGGWGWLASV